MSTLNPGQVILNRYRIEALAGSGGMAEVYRAWDAERSTFLALKLLRSDMAEDKVFLRRFKREAQTLARLQHPNIVRFYGMEQQGLLAFMLMDFIDGSSLRREIFESNRPFTDQRLLEVMQPVCAALQFAHRQGFVHCDIKPGNILIDKTGRIYLTDFGIARVTESATATMVGAGTPAYMAPEQARGLDPTPQTDIYALGVVLYEMLTGGERPFTGDHADTTGSTSEKVRWEQINLAPSSPRQFNANIPEALEAVVLQCLQKDPAQRYASALDVLTALTTAVGGVVSPVVNPVNPPDDNQPAQPAEELSASQPVLEPAGQDAVPQTPPPPAPAQSTPRRRVVPWLVGLAIFALLFLAYFMAGKSGAPAIPMPVKTATWTPVPIVILTIAQPSATTQVKCEYTVKDGDTFEKYQQKWGIRLADISCKPGSYRCAGGKFADQYLYSDMVLIFVNVAPYFCQDTIGGTPIPAITQEPTVSAGKCEYIVQDRDSLSKYNSEWGINAADISCKVGSLYCPDGQFVYNLRPEMILIFANVSPGFCQNTIGGTPFP
ncbi:MAG: serine/threonine-protein kinase [Anaerolineales bacterium]